MQIDNCIFSSLHEKATNKGWLPVGPFEHLLSYISLIFKKPLEPFN